MLISFFHREFSHIFMDENGGQRQSQHVYVYLFVGCLNLILPRGKGEKRLQREERARSRFDTGF